MSGRAAKQSPDAGADALVLSGLLDVESSFGGKGEPTSQFDRVAVSEQNAPTLIEYGVSRR